MGLKFRKDVVLWSIIAFILNLIIFGIFTFNFAVGLIVFGIVGLKIIFYPKLFFSFFIQIIFFQNSFIAFFSGYIESTTHFKILHGINYAVPVLLTVLVFKNNTHYFYKNFYYKSLVLLVLLLLYTLFGAYHFGLLNSIVYLRLFSTPLILFLAGIYFARTTNIKFMNNSLFCIFFICALVTLLQFLFPFYLSFILNDLDYFELKKNILSWDDLMAYYRSKPLFNLSWMQIKLVRIGSLIKSFISLGYFLTILGIYFYWPKKKLYFFLIVILTLISVNSKGALVFAFFTVFMYYLLYRTNLSNGLSMVLYGISNLLFILIGLNSQNEHILGFFHGLNYLFTLGNGLGFGGNLSNSLVADYMGTPLKDLGYYTRFQNGSESVFGVLFASLGIFSIYYLYFFFNFYKRISQKFGGLNARFNVLKILTIILFIQGIYQEEAFSPYAFGLVMFLVGVNYNKTYDQTEII
ncbi:hypothetical protein [Maribacter ulvicola]|uniref:O-Antigen ligase n=1 Tax=Maribacter ulvicola TaxID=228959 RepID=A0A1N6PJ22_9FLAO|nr:hypothetical protein [Maribacter ulvicola]SIQ04364.1 hypothetical protein SAMN05421797_101473 [Maribacter ulvicola]